MAVTPESWYQKFWIWYGVAVVVGVYVSVVAANLTTAWILRKWGW